MKRTPGLCLAAVVAASFCGCVTVGESPLPAGAIASGQRTIVAIFPSPGPVMREDDSTADNLAKFVPGMSFVIAATQNERDANASSELQSSLPPWTPAEDFYPVLAGALAPIGYPGKLVPPADAGLSTQTLSGLNRASGVIDWQLRYYVLNPSGERPKIPRDYAGAAPGAKDALILEVNLAFGAASDGKDGLIPTLSSVTKLVRADTMEVLWRREDSVDDKAAMKLRSYFMKHPDELLGEYRSLMPALAQATASHLSLNLRAAGL